MADTNTTAAITIGSVLAALSLDGNALVFGAIGGFLSLQRTEPKTTPGKMAGVLCSAALAAGAFAPVITTWIMTSNGTMPRDKVANAVACALGFGFFKVADPLLSALVKWWHKLLGVEPPAPAPQAPVAQAQPEKGST